MIEGVLPEGFAGVGLCHLSFPGIEVCVLWLKALFLTKVGKKPAS